MKAALIERAGDTGKLKNVPTPAPSHGEILVHISAIGVNPVDWKVRDSHSRALPFVLGQDFAGVVSATGDGITKYREGERIFGIARERGAYAEYTVVPEDDRAQPIARIPDGVSDAHAAALPTASLTALSALEALGAGSGTQLLVTGATGGVGGFAVQLAREHGAHVIGIASSKHYALARSLGVDDFVAYDYGDPIDAVKDAHPSGIDAVLDTASDTDRLKKIGELVRQGGSVVSIVQAADVAWFARHGINAINLVMSQTPQSSHDALRQLADLVDKKRLRVTIAEEYRLSEAEDALDHSKAGHVDGKIILTVDSASTR
jgi:NADPH:quinone reductase-like Zn-dependent oxidoreductase